MKKIKILSCAICALFMIGSTSVSVFGEEKEYEIEEFTVVTYDFVTGEKEYITCDTSITAQAIANGINELSTSGFCGTDALAQCKREDDMRDPAFHEGVAVSMDEIEITSMPQDTQPSIDEGTSVVELLPNGGIQITYHGGLNDGIAEYIFPWCAEEYYTEYGLQPND